MPFPVWIEQYFKRWQSEIIYPYISIEDIYPLPQKTKSPHSRITIFGNQEISRCRPETIGFKGNTLHFRSVRIAEQGSNLAP